MDNPYLVYCPHCGETLCTRCALLADEWNSLEKGDNWDPYVVRLRRRMKSHWRKYHPGGTETG